MSTITPSAMPTVEISEMNEIKWLRRRDRVYLSPTNRDSGWNMRALDHKAAPAYACLAAELVCPQAFHS
jgi:hypothetical protein